MAKEYFKYSQKNENKVECFRNDVCGSPTYMGTHCERSAAAAEFKKYIFSFLFSFNNIPLFFFTRRTGLRREVYLLLRVVQGFGEKCICCFAPYRVSERSVFVASRRTGCQRELYFFLRVVHGFGEKCICCFASYMVSERSVFVASRVVQGVGEKCIYCFASDRVSERSVFVASRRTGCRREVYFFHHVVQGVGREVYLLLRVVQGFGEKCICCFAPYRVSERSVFFSSRRTGLRREVYLLLRVVQGVGEKCICCFARRTGCRREVYYSSRWRACQAGQPTGDTDQRARRQTDETARMIFRKKKKNSVCVCVCALVPFPMHQFTLFFFLPAITLPPYFSTMHLTHRPPHTMPYPFVAAGTEVYDDCPPPCWRPRLYDGRWDFSAAARGAKSDVENNRC
ncbi:uncharacterized protein LOC134538036 [Bacillus rossius redtenbacheri]|uniref:uncharacterized protein LOC134538036 n=1 Tax=Bacillus rossius redtenbacheri TaxID=93214 RepID=UPI002FDDC78C